MGNRTCKKCGTEKPLDAEHFDTFIWDGRRFFRFTCLDCARKICAAKMRRLRRARRAANPLPIVDFVRDGVLMRVCGQCKTHKALNAQNFKKFHRADKKKAGDPAYFSRKCVKCLFSLGDESGKRHYAKAMLDSARVRAKIDGVPCTITIKDIIIPEICPVFGMKLEIGNRTHHDASPTLDRHIPSLGYVPGNVAVLSHKANRLKSDGSLEELKQMRSYLKEVIAYMENKSICPKGDEECKVKS